MSVNVTVPVGTMPLPSVLATCAVRSSGRPVTIVAGDAASVVCVSWRTVPETVRTDGADVELSSVRFCDATKLAVIE